MKVQYTTISFFMLLTIYLFAASFFSLLDVAAIRQDLILLLSLILIYFNFTKVKSLLNTNNQYIVLLLLYAFLSSIIMAYINFGQPVSYSVLAARIMLIMLFMFVALKALYGNIDLALLYKTTFAVALLYAGISFFIYFTGYLDLVIYDTTYASKLGNIRITLAYETMVVLIFFFYYDTANRKINYIPFLSLLATLIIVDQTRGILVGVLLVLFFSVLNFKKKNTVYLWLAVLLAIFLSFVFSGLEYSILSPLYDLYTATQTEIQSGQGNVNVRSLELAYFWDRLNVESMIFGYGIDNHSFIYLYPKEFYLSDLGIFKPFYLHGIVGLLLFTAMYYKLYKESLKQNTSLHKTGKAIVLFQLFAPTLNWMHSLHGMFLFFSLFILISYSNQRKLSE